MLISSTNAAIEDDLQLHRLPGYHRDLLKLALDGIGACLRYYHRIGARRQDGGEFSLLVRRLLGHFPPLEWHKEHLSIGDGTWRTGVGHLIYRAAWACQHHPIH